MTWTCHGRSFFFGGGGGGGVTVRVCSMLNVISVFFSPDDVVGYHERQASICAGDRGGKVLFCDGHRYHKRGEMVIQRTKSMYIMKKNVKTF